MRHAVIFALAGLSLVMVVLLMMFSARLAEQRRGGAEEEAPAGAGEVLVLGERGELIVVPDARGRTLEEVREIAQRIAKQQRREEEQARGRWIDRATGDVAIANDAGAPGKDLARSFDGGGHVRGAGDPVKATEELLPKEPQPPDDKLKMPLDELPSRSRSQQVQHSTASAAPVPKEEHVHPAEQFGKEEKADNEEEKEEEPMETSAPLTLAPGGDGQELEELDSSQIGARPLAEFVLDKHRRRLDGGLVNTLSTLLACGEDMERACGKATASLKDATWCQRVHKKHGVVIGRTWGSLPGRDRSRWTDIGCDSVVMMRQQPTCDSSWGLPFLDDWRARQVSKCADAFKSRISCRVSVHDQLFCDMHNIKVDMRLSKIKNLKKNTRRGGTYLGREFSDGFLKSDCGQAEPLHEWIAPGYQSGKHFSMDQGCDVTIDDPVVVLAHDNVYNFGHTTSDMMNAWLSPKLAERDGKEFAALIFDSYRLGGRIQNKTHPDFLTHFSDSHYSTIFKRILYARDYQDKTVCFREFSTTPRAGMAWVFTDWTRPSVCAQLCNSPMYQRYNLDLRSGYGLLGHTPAFVTNNFIQVIMIVRKRETARNKQQNRFVANEDAVIEALNEIPNVRAKPVDMAAYSMPEQIKIIANASIIVGMHGAGIVHLTHMSVGHPNCCGVLEIMPSGFHSIWGHGNMARFTGAYYTQVNSNSHGHREGASGTVLNTADISKRVRELVSHIHHQPSCLRRQVLDV